MGSGWCVLVRIGEDSGGGMAGWLFGVVRRWMLEGL